MSEIFQARSEVYAGTVPSFSREDARTGRQRSRPETGLIALQHEQGAWEGEVIWCPMITAQLVIARTIIGRKGDSEWTDGVIRYFQTTRNADGGWGLHPVSASYLYVTTLVYVALRLLGEPANGPTAGPARAWIAEHPEGVTALPSWGKLWLSFAGLYSYDGVNPVPPELFLLPRWSPILADHLYCHTRYIYLGLAYLYGCRFSADLGEIGRSLRDELYGRPFHEIDFAANRDRIAESDLYVAPGHLLRGINAGLRLAGALRRKLGIGCRLRRKALHHCLSLIRGEVLATEAQCLSPVNGLLNLLALHANDPTDPLIDRLLDGLEAWRWQDEDGGIRYAGARSQTWDTALALQALLPAVTPEAAVVTAIRTGYSYLAAGQCRAEPVPRNPDRQAAVGGWCFCDGAHNWPVSDCTAEALTAILGCHDVDGLICPADRIGPERLAAAAEFILDRQNADGGFGSYERRRGPRFLERLNPSEMFGRCMTERSYVECTASCIEALAQFARQRPPLTDDGRIARALQDGVDFLRRAQRPDGSYPGFWGINFIYATSFVLRAFAAVGRPQTDRTVQRALDWLDARQRSDGGWGEHFSGCLDDRYIENPVSLISGTSWALLGLLAFYGAERQSIARGLNWLDGRLQIDGQLPRESVNGVFFGTAMLEYALYNTSFGTWALRRGLERRGHG